MPFNKIRITGYRVCIPYIQVFHFVCGAICLQVEVFSVGAKVMLGVFWG